MISMADFSQQVAAVGVVIFDMIRSVFNLYTSNTVLFAFICVAVFGAALVLATQLFKSTVNMAISSVDGKLILSEAFDDLTNKHQKIHQPFDLKEKFSLQDDESENEKSHRLSDMME